MSIWRKVKRKLIGLSSRETIEELRAGGGRIGKGTIIFDPKNTVIDGSRPWLLEIGEYNKITRGVIILTHDYSLSVMRRVYGEWIGEGQKTVIGDNCFLGMNSIILMGTRIGNNVIVGAGSVCHGVIPDNVVVAGNPARIIASLNEHHQTRAEKTVRECLECVKEYRKKMGRFPVPSELTGFKFLFAPRDSQTIQKYGLTFFCNGDEPQEVEEAFYQTEPYWKDYDALLDAARAEMKSGT